MRILSEFFRQEVPRSGGATPASYRRALFISEAILAIYFLAGAVLSIRAAGKWLWPPVILLAGMVLLLLNIDRMGPRLNLLGCAAALGAWLVWFVYTFGWSAGSANLLIILLPMVFFKHVNDTYGHNCGDYTLKQLAALFMVAAGEKYKVCRWGGEEFCFFLPGMNIDDARREMQDLNIAVRRQRLHYGDIEYAVTITIGVEENDYQSTMEEILHQADRKLYMGKVGGRDQVVV